ncbi:MAG: glycosyltransferase [Pyrinomonadaceae bacterium]
MPKTLYICYFWLNESLVQSQVLPYLRELRKGGVEVTLLTFEADFDATWTEEKLQTARQEMASEGIGWEYLRYHKRPSVPATLFDIMNGARVVGKLLRHHRFDVLHCRVHVPALMAVIARRFSQYKPKILFDIRGFFPEEYTDAGLWPREGWLFKTVKSIEARLMKESDAFVVLTEAAREVLFPESRENGYDRGGRPVEVIPCCVDLRRRFSRDRQVLRDETRRQLKVEDRFVITHIGGLSGLYLTDKLADLLGAARAEDASTFAMFLTQADPELIVPLLKARGFGDADLFVGKVAPTEIPAYLSASDVGLSFVKAGYATKSRSPTKIPEYLAAGVPIIANAGVGDVDRLIERNGVGTLVEDLSDDSYLRAIRRIKELGDISDTCIATARREFDLEQVGGTRYRRLYDRLLRTK